MGDAEDTGTGRPADEDFLGRWSRRKLADQKGETVIDPGTAATTAGREPGDAAAAVVTDHRQELTDADMPSIDSLDGDSDFSQFMSPGVSQQLRTQALRKLFHLPAFNVTDGLNDYDEDYTQFTGLGDVVTQEMKRMLQRELEAEAADEDEETDTEAPEELADTDLTENTDDDNA